MKQSTSMPMILAEGTEFSCGHRSGTVYRATSLGCEVVWHEQIDGRTGEVLKSIADFIPAEVIARDVSRGAIRIVSLPVAAVGGRPSIQPHPPTVSELARASNRECYILAAQSLIDSGKMRPRRSDFVWNFPELYQLGHREAYARASRNGKGSECGAKLEMLHPPKCGETIFRWWLNWSSSGRTMNMDEFRNSGRKPGARYTHQENEFYKSVIAARLTEERPSISSIVCSVQSAVRVENNFMLSQPVPGRPMEVPGYDWIMGLIAQIAPVDHKVRTHGMDVAYRDLHTLGLGLQVTRVLERVELDEYTVDLMVFLRLLKLETLLTQEEAAALGLDGTPRRLTLSCAIDVYSGAIVGLQIASGTEVNVALRTIEMIYLDKQPLADAVGAQMPWPMHGQPQTLALDRASINMSDIVYLRLSHAGITNLAVPAGKPFLKPWIERFLATVGALFLQRFTGRTFSDVVRKGENDPAARATVTLEEFLHWLTRWIVDVYHTRKPETLGRKSPLEAWNQAVALSPPLVRADQRMLRNAFGTALTCRASRDGVTVRGIRYQHEELANWFLNETERDLTVVWWDKNIGAIEVHLPDGRLFTAHCVDPQWLDKSFEDLLRLRHEDVQAKLYGQDERDRATVEIDRFTQQKAALRGLLPIVPTAEDLARRTRDFSRYMSTTERRHEGYGDVFDNEVQPPSRNGARPADLTDLTLSAHPNAQHPGDIME